MSQLPEQQRLTGCNIHFLVIFNSNLYAVIFNYHRKQIEVPAESQPHIKKLAIEYSKVNSSVPAFIKKRKQPTQNPIQRGQWNNVFHFLL